MYMINNMNNNMTNNRANGRVIINQPSMNQFQLFDNPANNYGNAESYVDALNGNWVDTLLSKAFFSKENIRIIQNGIKAGVYQYSNKQFIIDDQNHTTLKIIMRSIFLQYAKHITGKEREEIVYLNNKVLEYSIKSVYDSYVSYQKYINDVSTLADPMDRPEYTNVKGNKSLEMKPFF